MEDQSLAEKLIGINGLEQIVSSLNGISGLSNIQIQNFNPEKSQTEPVYRVLADEGNKCIILEIEGIEGQLRITTDYTCQNVGDLIGKVRENLRSKDLCQVLTAYHHKQFNQLEGDKQISQMMKLLEEQLGVNENVKTTGLVDARVHASIIGGFYRLDYHTGNRTLTGIMVSKESPNLGLEFEVEISNQLYGRIVRDRLKYYTKVK